MTESNIVTSLLPHCSSTWLPISNCTHSRFTYLFLLSTSDYSQKWNVKKHSNHCSQKMSTLRKKFTQKKTFKAIRGFKLKTVTRIPGYASTFIYPKSDSFTSLINMTNFKQGNTLKNISFMQNHVFFFSTSFVWYSRNINFQCKVNCIISFETLKEYFWGLL